MILKVTLKMPLRSIMLDHGIYRVAARSKLRRSLRSSEWIDGKGKPFSVARDKTCLS